MAEIIVGRRSEKKGGGGDPFGRKSGTPLPFHKFSYKVEILTKISEKSQNSQKVPKSIQNKLKKVSNGSFERFWSIFVPENALTGIFVFLFF
jgi:hypothetical protein